MNNKEFFNEFNFRFNNLFSNQAPGLDTYEISLLLTQAQDEIVKAYSNPKKNKLQEGYDMSRRRQLDFSAITKTMKLTSPIKVTKFIDAEESKCYAFPINIICVLNETLTVKNSDNIKQILQVTPITFQEIEDIFSQPFPYPTKRKAWRILTDYNTTDNSIAQVFYHTGETPVEYKIRYIKKPHPIILEDLYGQSIEGYSLASADTTKKVGGTEIRVPSGSDCELPEELHTEIVQRAVELAKASFQGGLAEILTVGNQSGTDIGVITNTK